MMPIMSHKSCFARQTAEALPLPGGCLCYLQVVYLVFDILLILCGFVPMSFLIQSMQNFYLQDSFRNFLPNESKN